MQYMERELGQLLSVPSILPAAMSETTTTARNQQGQGKGHLIDRMQGIGFLSIIEYARGKPKISTSRALTVDMAYDQKVLSGGVRNTNTVVRFGELLSHSLCKEAPLRAWCDETRSYEAVVQRKIATSLPSLVSLSCCCAGRKADSHGLQFWQQEGVRNWLPEFIEVRIEVDRSITVRELTTREDGTDEWMTFGQELPLADDFFDAWEGGDLLSRENLPIEKSYRLESAVSFVRTDLGGAPAGDALHPSHLTCGEGHHVVHVRKSANLEIEVLEKQLRRIEKCLVEGGSVPDTGEAADDDRLTNISGVSLHERRQHLEEQLRTLENKKETKINGSDDQWLLLNGFVVTELDNSDDVRSFNAKFKEP